MKRILSTTQEVVQQTRAGINPLAARALLGTLLLLSLFACNREASGGGEGGETSTTDGEESGDPTCGDGLLDADESCDDGNSSSGDGCSSSCEVEKFFACGDDGIMCEPVRILIGTTGEDDPSVRSAVADITGGPVDYVDIRTTALDSPELIGAYDCVYMQFADGRAEDEEARAQTLLEFSEGGGVVVLGYGALELLDEGIATEEHLPGFFTGLGLDNFYNRDGSQVLFGGVESIGYSAFSSVAHLFPGAIADGTLGQNPQPEYTAAAYYPDMRIVLLAGSIMPLKDHPTPPSGDYDILLANACSAAYGL